MFPLSTPYIVLLGFAAGAVVGVWCRPQGTELNRTLWSFRVLSAVLVTVTIASLLSLVLGGSGAVFSAKDGAALIEDPEKLAAAMQEHEAILAAITGAFMCTAFALVLWLLVGLLPLLRQMGTQAVEVEQDRKTQEQIKKWKLSDRQQVGVAEQT